MPVEFQNDRTERGTLSSFIAKLMTEGVAMIHAHEELPDEDGECRQRLNHWEASCRSDLSGEAPDFTCDVAVWAVKVFYRASQFVVCRDAPEPVIVDALQKA